MSKRLFQVLDEMNVNDEANKTETCACCFDLIGANKVKAGGHVTMGVPTEAVLKLLLGEYQPMLVLLDKKVYHRLKDQPQDFEADKAKLNRMLKSAVDTGKKAIDRAERYEEALQLIEQMSDPGDHWKAICDMKAIASEVLKTKQLPMTQITDKIYAVELPSIAFGLMVNNYGNESELMYMLSMSDIADVDNAEETLITKPLPPGTWQFLFTTKTATEEDARKVVKSDELFINGNSQGVYYCNYHCQHDVCEWYKEATESLHSLLRSKNLDPENNYALIEK